MMHERWIGSHDWKRSNESIDGYPSRNERSQTDIQDLDDLITWLEYGKTSGNIAMRQSQKQEEYWGKLVRDILCEKLIKDLVFFGNNAFECRCKHCNRKIRGHIDIDAKKGIEAIVPSHIYGFCECLESRQSDILQYIACKFEK